MKQKSMLNKVYTIRIFSVIIFVVLCLPYHALGQNTPSPVSQQTILSSDNSGFLRGSDLVGFQRESIWQITLINLGFLSICVVIILAIAGGFYIFNLGPLKEKIDKIEDELKAKINALVKDQKHQTKNLEKNVKREVLFLRKDSLSKISFLQENIKRESDNLSKKIEESLSFEVKRSNAVTEKIKEDVAKTLTNMDSKFHTMEISREWDTHYVWQSLGVYINVLSSLINVIRLSVQYNQPFWTELCLSDIDSNFDQLDKLNYYPYEENLHKQLVMLMENIKDERYNVIKESILKKATQLLSKPKTKELPGL